MQELLNDQSKLKKMKKIRNKIPEDKKELFDFKIKWKQLFMREKFAKVLDFFLENKSIEYFTIKEDLFI